MLAIALEPPAKRRAESDLDAISFALLADALASLVFVAVVRWAAAMGEDLKDAQLDPTLSSSFTTAAEQSGKLGLGYHLTLDCYYDNYTLVQMNLLPLVVTMLAAPDANIQLLHNCMPEISRLLEPVRMSVHQTVQQSATQEA